GGHTPCLAITGLLSLPIRSALVALDHSPASRGALLVALSWVSALGARSASGERPMLTALHVDTGTHAANQSFITQTVQNEVGVLRRSAGDWAGVNVHSVTLTGRKPAEVIVDYVREHAPDLVVLGTRGLGDSNSMSMGSVAAAVTSRLATPVLLVPPAVWRNHVQRADWY